MKTSKNTIDMLHGPLLGKLLAFALPLAASSVLQQLFNSADIAVVGRFAGSEAQAAVGSNSAVISLFINLFVGLSVGANAVIANYIGQNKKEKIRTALHTIMAVALISGIFLMILGTLLARPILTLMSTPDNVLEQAILYLRIYFVGMPVIMIYNFGSAILRSKGDSRRPLYCLVLSGIINVVLNLILVIPFHMSVAGVGIATVTANTVSAGLILFFLLTEEEPFLFRPRMLSVDIESLVKIIHIGIPAGIQGMVFSLANICIQSAVNGFGSNAMAGNTNSMNFEYFSAFFVTAFSQATVTFTSQNYGARNYARCKRVFWLCMAAAPLTSGFLSVLFFLCRGTLIRIYTIDDAVIAFAMIRMTHCLLFEWMTSSYEISASALRGIGYSVLPTLITVFGTCILRLVWLQTVFAASPAYATLLTVYPLSWLITGFIMQITYFLLRRKKLCQQD